MSPTTPAELHFVPWVRSGAAAGTGAPDTLTKPLPPGSPLEPWLRVGGHEFSQPARLRGPGHVTALAPHVIGRMEPPPGTADFEPNFFAFVELVGAPDLPWRFTPAAPGDRSQLRPWLLLVVVREQDGVHVGPVGGSPLPLLRIEAPAQLASELPDLADSAAWAHVQLTVPPEDIPAAAGGVTVTRLLCPRRLLPNESWHACLVPAFDVGVRAGSGADAATAASVRPAWKLTDAALDPLPVYHHWTFSTGPDGDFESLARRLGPDDGGAVLGRVWLDIQRPGPPLPEPPRGAAALTAFVGALKTPGARRGGAPKEHTAWLESTLEPILERGAERLVFDAEAGDPVVAPPLYAGPQAGRDDVPPTGDADQPWLRPLNLDPTLRAAAGVGAAVVRANQEALVASAWAQVGPAREAARAVDQGLLSAEVGRCLARRLRTLDDGSILQVTQRTHAWIRSPASTATLARDLERGPAPGGLVSAALLRATRPATPLARTWTAHPPTPADARLTGAVTTALLDATSPRAAPDLRGALAFAAAGLAAGAWTGQTAHSGPVSGGIAGTVSPSAHTGALTTAAMGSHTAPGGMAATFSGTLASAISLADHLAGTVTQPGPATSPATPADALDLSGAADAVVSGLDPLPSIAAGLQLRVAGLSALLSTDGALPHRLVVHPLFTDPLSWDLLRLDRRYLLPGAELLASNRVALLAVDNDYVAAFMAGVNHELGRELVWREFPTSPSLTFAHRFWDTGEGGPDDIGPIAGWTAPRPGGNVIGAGADALCVVLVRGDLIRRYPGAHVYVVKGAWKAGEVVPDDERSEEVVLQGTLDRQSAFYGFPVSTAAMRGDRTSTSHSDETAGWFVAIEEPSHGPRFGLDLPAEDGSDLGDRPVDWNDLSWAHLVPRGGSIDEITHAVAADPLPRPPKSAASPLWGHNAAHMAAICWQRPFRVLLHGDLLLPGV